MRKLFLYLLFSGGILLLAAIIWFGHIFYDQYRQHRYTSSYVPSTTSTASPNVRVLEDSIRMPYADTSREIHLYLPPGYATDSTKRYPVIYLMDGESAFDEAVSGGPEWRADEVADSLARMGKGEVIIVAVTDGKQQRNNEYNPFPGGQYPEALGDKHADWIAHGLKQWADTTLRTLPGPSNTTIGGISLSGMMAYYMLMTFPEVYGNAFIYSPSTWVAEEKLLSIASEKEDWSGVRVHLAVGAREGEMVELALRLRNRLSASGLPRENLRYDEIPKEYHWHMTWRKSLAIGLPWLLEGGGDAGAMR